VSDVSTAPSGVPAVSIVVAAYNAAVTLPETIESAVAQTCDEWELIIVDDGSTDATLKLAQDSAAADARIHVITQPNAGTALARNAGFATAEGAWLCFLDADDAMHPEYVERMLAFAAAHPGYDIYGCNADVVLRGGGRDLMWKGARWRGVHEVTAEEQFAESSISPVTLFRPEVFEAVGGFRPVYSEDYDFWLRALILGFRHLYSPEILWQYRRHEGSKTTALVREAESLLQIHRDARAMSELSAALRTSANRAIAFSEARIGRRHLEEALLRGEYAGARTAYVRSRRAFPGAAKYGVGFVLMMVSPALYARVKAGRMV
jgi:glycosyltransferase involved in cell wall biosynthesis